MQLTYQIATSILQAVTKLGMAVEGYCVKFSDTSFRKTLQLMLVFVEEILIVNEAIRV